MLLAADIVPRTSRTYASSRARARARPNWQVLEHVVYVVRITRLACTCTPTPDISAQLEPHRLVIGRLLDVIRQHLTGHLNGTPRTLQLREGVLSLLTEQCCAPRLHCVCAFEKFPMESDSLHDGIVRTPAVTLTRVLVRNHFHVIP